MDELLLTNIFFMITALAVIAITAGVPVIIWFVIPIVRDIREIVSKIRRAGDAVEKDFEALRVNLREEGTKGKAILDAALGFIARKVGVRRKVRKNDEE